MCADATSVMLEEQQPLVAQGGADQLFDAAPEALLVVLDERVVTANACAIELIGADPSGTAVGDLIRGWSGADHSSPLDAELERPDLDDLPVEVRTRATAHGAL